ncbi:MAG: nucleotide exchange factor GrpE [Candidatus Nomurabacteria bacterium]|jgi:molecular chaperone GrpE|nr:nucleotide exchange factor GrpE [Candidatus Nomurabacteria bacterium]
MAKKRNRKAEQTAGAAALANGAGEARVLELTEGLKRLQADFENYRKRADEDKTRARAHGAEDMVKRFLPVLDTIDRAVAGVPKDIADNAWVQGVAGLAKNLANIEAEIGLEKIVATAGTEFNHELHHAVQMDEGEGETEVVAEELQSGYMLDGQVLREAVVRVARK